MNVIYVVTTGGTIEKGYLERNGSVENLINKIERFLRLLRLSDSEVNVVPLLNKDSLEMNDSDRGLIAATVRGLLVENAPIIITHGTDTMVETGVFLKHSLPHIAVPIVITGAMAPLGFQDSDGLQNLTEILFAARLLPGGIYVVIHNQVFPIDRVRKDRSPGRYASFDPKPMSSA
jgi:L-asparaginase